MNHYHHLTCREWDEKLEMTDPEMLTDEEIEGYNLHIASCSRCASLISDPEMDTLIRENISLEEVFTMLPSETHEASKNETGRKLRRTIFIGLGGIGNEIVCRLKREIEVHQFDTPLFQYCVIDNSKHTSDAPFQGENSTYINIGHSISDNTPCSSEISRAIESWWGERSTAYIEVDESVRQMRAVGRRQLFEHFDEVKTALQTIVGATTNGRVHRQVASQGFEVLDAPPVVYLVFSSGDAVGSGLFLDIAYLIRELFKTSMSPEIVAFAMLPDARQRMTEPYMRIQANAYAALQELEYYTKTTSTWNVSYPSHVHISSTQPPFSSVFLVDTVHEKGKTYPVEYVYEQVNRLLFWLHSPEISTSMFKHNEFLHVDDMHSWLAPPGCIKHEQGNVNGHEGGSEDIGQLPIYSTFGISHVRLDWQAERVRPQAEMFLYDQFLRQQAISPTLPAFLRNATTLYKTVMKDVSSFQSYTLDEKLYIGGEILPQYVASELLALQQEYSKRLSSFENDSQWQQVEMKYTEQAKAAISAFIHTALKEHGPVYVYQALEKMLSSMEAMQVTLEKMYKEQIRCENAQGKNVAETFAEWHTSSDAQDINRKGRWFSKKNPHISHQDEQKINDHLYKQYRETVLTICYKHIITQLFDPISRFVKQQQEVFVDAKSKLTALYAHALERANAQEQWKDVTPFLENVVQPRLHEQQHLDDMIITGKFDIEARAHEALQETYDVWPFDDDDTDGIGRLQEYINAQVTQALLDSGKHEHPAYRLQSHECSVPRRRFVTESAVVVNFTDTAKRWLLSTLDTLHILNYGLSPSQTGSRRDVELALNRLSVDIAAEPHLRLTESENELTLIKIVHGFSLSTLAVFDELLCAYKLIAETAYAPYLHFHLHLHKGAHSALSRETITIERLLETWRTLLETVSRKRTVLFIDLEDIFKPLEDYYRLETSRTDGIKVDTPDHPFFDVLFNLKEAITSQLNVLSVETMQTPEIRQLLTTLADMEALLFRQDWHKIDPPQYTLFDPRFHHRHLEDDTEWPAHRKARIIEVVSPGYVRQYPHTEPIIRRAEVIISHWSNDNEERPVVAEQRQ